MAQLIINTPEPKGLLHKVIPDHIDLKGEEKVLKCSLCGQEEIIPGWIKKLEDFISFSASFRSRHTH